MRGYESAFPETAALPQPAELVVRIDVIEHVEPDRPEAVLDDLARVIGRAALVVASTRPAVPRFPDGR
ncbi:MAG: hypothetical protein D6718_12955 [Acidobacteria bacterium]|nr:MAG: hypothetical protein D6718_12955 [Acidobacteriota bacterium]